MIIKLVLIVIIFDRGYKFIYLKLGNLLQKALSIKKKQINKQYDLSVLDQISDDETPMEEIKQKHRAVTPPPVRPLPPTIQTPIQQTKKTFTFL